MKLAIAATLIATASAFSVNKEVAKVCLIRVSDVDLGRFPHRAFGGALAGGGFLGTWLTRSFR